MHKVVKQNEVSCGLSVNPIATKVICTMLTSLNKFR